VRTETKKHSYWRYLPKAVLPCFSLKFHRIHGFFMGCRTLPKQSNTPPGKDKLAKWRISVIFQVT